MYGLYHTVRGENSPEFTVVELMSTYHHQCWHRGKGKEGDRTAWAGELI